MTTPILADLRRIQWLLAEHLERMRAFCDSPDNPNPLHAVGCPRKACRGFAPAPLTAEGLIDIGRLLEAIEGTGFEVERLWTTGSSYAWKATWVVNGVRLKRQSLAFNFDLALAYLEAMGVEVRG